MPVSDRGLIATRGPTVWDPEGRFIARRPFRLNGRAIARGEDVMLAEAGSDQAMRRLTQSRHVACIPSGLAVPPGLLPAQEAQDGAAPTPGPAAPDEPADPPRRGPGRPLGSKNKPTPAAAAPQPAPVSDDPGTAPG
jgi:hypothetical protein